MKVKKVPLRKCVVCGERKDKKELIRVVKNKDDEIFVDESGKLNGRGAYLCRTEECLENARANHKLDKVLKAKVSKEIYDEIMGTF